MQIYFLIILLSLNTLSFGQNFEAALQRFSASLKNLSNTFRGKTEQPQEEPTKEPVNKGNKWHEGTIDEDSLYALAQQFNDNKIDAYELLGVNPASADAKSRARRIYKKLSLIYHPDKYKGTAPEKANVIMAALTTANQKI